MILEESPNEFAGLHFYLSKNESWHFKNYIMQKKTDSDSKKKTLAAEKAQHKGMHSS